MILKKINEMCYFTQMKKKSEKYLYQHIEFNNEVFKAISVINDTISVINLWNEWYRTWSSEKSFNFNK